jgi:hypothetical protein
LFLYAKDLNACWEEKRCLQGFYGVPDGNAPLGSPRRRRKDNIKMDLEAVGCGGLYWVDRDRGNWRAFVNKVTNVSVCIKCGGIY